MSDNDTIDDVLEVPEDPAWKRWGLDVLQGAISSAPIPFLSGIAGNLFADLAQERIHQRQEKLIRDIVTGLETLREEHAELTVEKLATNDAFVTTMLQAVETAQRAYEQEKLDALRNIVLHTALIATSPTPDSGSPLRQPFMALVRDLTPCEMTLLTFFHDPRPFGIENLSDVDQPYPSSGASSSKMTSATEMISNAIPCLRGRWSLYFFFVHDLSVRGLVRSPLNVGLEAARLTDIGESFLWFIQSPLAETER